MLNDNKAEIESLKAIIESKDKSYVYSQAKVEDNWVFKQINLCPQDIEIVTNFESKMH